MKVDQTPDEGERRYYKYSDDEERGERSYNHTEIQKVDEFEVIDNSNSKTMTTTQRIRT